jgi:DNA-binding transcriptional MerR regulator
MDISEVTKRTGLPASALRFYEEKGLIASLGRKGERRQFSANVMDQLALIALGQTAGFTLEQIRNMLGEDGQAELDRARLLQKADEVDATIKRLRAVSKGLRHAAVCPAPRHAECATFKKLLREALPAPAARRPKPAKPGAGRVSPIPTDHGTS